MRSVVAAAALYSFVATSPTPVTIREFAFEPSSVTVETNQTVTWTNRGALAHTVKFDKDPEGSGQIEPGKTTSDAISTPGTYRYTCEIHASMTGSVVVTAATPTSSTTSTTRPRPTSTTTTTTTDPGSTVTAPTDSTSSTTTSPAGEPTTTSITSGLEAATRVTDKDDADDDNVDMPGAVAALLLLVTAAAAFAQTRGGFR